jgi:NitT/TauT family transport system substrate-binding protein
VKLDGPIRGEHAVFFVAKDKGYLSAENIEMTVEAGGPALNTLLLVSHGQFEVGFADLPSLIVARTTGLQVRALAVLNQHTPLALVALKATGLGTPRDLEGKTVGIGDGAPGWLFYRTLLVAHGIDRAKITEVPLAPPYLPALVARKV